MTHAALGILGYDSYTFVVENLARSRQFYVEKLGFREIARSLPVYAQQRGQQAAMFGAGDVRVVVTTPLMQSSAAARYLHRHPAGIAEVAFRVEDLEQARSFLSARQATFLDDDEDERAASDQNYRSFRIATPLGDVVFRYVQRTDDARFSSSFERFGPDSLFSISPGGAIPNPLRIERVDHITANARTMAPVVKWYQDTLGMEEFWRVSFHTDDVIAGRIDGTGLKSIVMRDPASPAIKFATNEPLAPFFERSQVAKFCDDNCGPGVQHLAFAVPDILKAVGSLQDAELPFLTTPASYYRALPERLARLRITNLQEDLAMLEQRGIEVDGENDRYMLQIFLREAAATYGDERAGPFFYEFIQRAGDEGFGYGNFRALFESIERTQTSASPAG